MWARCRRWCPTLHKRLFLRNHNGVNVDVYDKLAERCDRRQGSANDYYFFSRGIRAAVYAHTLFELLVCMAGYSEEHLLFGCDGLGRAFYRLTAKYRGRRGAYQVATQSSAKVMYQKDLITNGYTMSYCWFDDDEHPARVDLLLPVCRRLYQSMVKRFYCALKQVRVVCTAKGLTSSDIHVLITRYLCAYSGNLLSSTSASLMAARCRQRQEAEPGS